MYFIYGKRPHRFAASPLRGFAACVFPTPLVNTRFVWTASYAWTGVNIRYDRVISTYGKYRRFLVVGACVFSSRASDTNGYILEVLLKFGG